MPKSFIVIGLGYGDEGKGSWVEHLVRKHGVKFVARFNGGAQARHHVVTPDGKFHGFSQFSSGTLVPGVNTLLSRFMLVEPLFLLEEAKRLAQKGVNDALQRMLISRDAPLITPINMLLNRIMEVKRGNARHGSCGFGIGLTQADVETLGEDAFYIRDIGTKGAIDKLQYLWNLKLEKAFEFRTEGNEALIEELRTFNKKRYLEGLENFKKTVRVMPDENIRQIVNTNAVVFEGAQGVLLDQKYGTFPHCTRSNTTFENAETLLKESEVYDYEKIGLLRGYMTRHGAGPFVTEEAIDVPACHNAEDPWQGKFRNGWFDVVAAKYALDCIGGVDTLAITNLDRMTRLPEVKICVEYENADPRYFEAGRIMDLNGDLSLRAKQTEALNSVRPAYQAYSSWKNYEDKAMTNYLDAISINIGKAVTAFSADITHHKIYL